MCYKIHKLITHHALYRFGKCEKYRSGNPYCDKVFRAGTDNIYVASVHGSQSNITAFLLQYIPQNLEDISLIDHPLCYENILRIICNYYMSPCRNESSQLAPSSICPQECSEVEKNCSTLWGIAAHALREHEFISCERTSTFIFPLPSCCTAVNIQKKTPIGMFHHILMTITFHYKLDLTADEKTSDMNSSASIIVSLVVTAMLLIAAILAMVVVLFCYRRSKNRRRQLNQLQNDNARYYN